MWAPNDLGVEGFSAGRENRQLLFQPEGPTWTLFPAPKLKTRGMLVIVNICSGFPMARAPSRSQRAFPYVRDMRIFVL